MAKVKRMRDSWNRWDRANREAANDRRRKWLRTPAGQALKRRVRSNRRARKHGVTATLTKEEWNGVWSDYDGKCVYCGNPATTQDHVIPLSRGGTHSRDNVVPACLPCNDRKRVKLPNE